VELLSQLTWVDLAIIFILAAGVFVGFTQGMIRYLLNSIAVLVAFVLASQLKGPLVDLLGFWQAFTPEGRELLVYAILFIGFVVGGWFAVRALYHRGRMPIPRQLDEIGGAIFGLLYVALLLSFQLVVLDSYYVPGAETTGFLGSYYDVMNESVIITFFRDTLIPTAGFLARPFVPDEIASLLVP
jgi:uncharacterized membrane protein required for colicin V production